MANLYAIAFSVLGCTIAHSALLVWTAVLLQQPVERARRRIEQNPWKCLLWGAVTAFLTVLLLAIYFLLRDRNLQFVSHALEGAGKSLGFLRFYNDAWIVTNCLAWVLAGPLLASLIVGEAAFTQLFAAKIHRKTLEDRPLRALSAGAVSLTCSYGLPFVGWFLFLPIVATLSVGAGLLGLLGAVRHSWPARSTRTDNHEQPMHAR